MSMQSRFIGTPLPRLEDPDLARGNACFLADLKAAEVLTVRFARCPVGRHGQLHGGVALGIGQALGEKIVYDPTGRLLTDSFETYMLPRVDEVPRIDVREHSCASRNNAYGIKGAGENGTMGAIPAIVGAVEDALAPLGLMLNQMAAQRESLAWLAKDGMRANTSRHDLMT